MVAAAESGAAEGIGQDDIRARVDETAMHSLDAFRVVKIPKFARGSAVQPELKQGCSHASVGHENLFLLEKGAEFIGGNTQEFLLDFRVAERRFYPVGSKPCGICSRKRIRIGLSRVSGAVSETIWLVIGTLAPAHIKDPA
jgi:hypothetical protein